MSGTRTWKRRRIWIDGPFQARWLALVVGVSVALLLVLGTLWTGALSEQRRILGVSHLSGTASQVDPTAAEFDAELGAAATMRDRDRVIALGALAILLVTVLAYGSILMAFRAAGPAHAVSLMLKSLADGDLAAVRRLRHGDQFRFLEDDVAALRDAMKHDADADGDLMARAAGALRAVPGATADALALAAALEAAATVKSRRAGSATADEEATKR